MLSNDVMGCGHSSVVVYCVVVLHISCAQRKLIPISKHCTNTRASMVVCRCRTCETGHGNGRGVLARCQRGDLKSTNKFTSIIKTHTQRRSLAGAAERLHAALTGVQLKEQLDGEVVEVATVLDDLDEGRQPTLTRGQRGHGD